MQNRGIWQDEIGWWLIALAVLVISITAYGIYSGKLGDFGRYIQQIFRFGS